MADLGASFAGMHASRFDEAKAVHQSGDLTRAAELYHQAADEDPREFRALHNLGATLEALGRVDEAVAAYQHALVIQPDSAWTLYNLARLKHLANDLLGAESGYRRAIELQPDLVGAQFNLGRLLLERGDSRAAELTLDECLRLDPEDAAAQSFLGDALFSQRRMSEALQAYRRTAELEPGVSITHYDVAKTLESLRRPDEAIECYRRCVVLDPLSAAAREGLARAFDASGRHDEAVASLHEWLSLAPGHAVAEHLLASLGAIDPPERASDGYVRDTFDRFAADFDVTLARLEYQAPRLVSAALEDACGKPSGTLDVLDLGCGTGLCAPLLRGFAKRLEGVDLSTAMLERARHRDVYDALHEAELSAFLAAYDSSWDVIVAADTFCYFGALEDVLRRARAALRRGGVLVFTLERLEEGRHYAISPHGRFAHTEAYVRAAMAAAEFDTSVIRAPLRQEGGHMVDGVVTTGNVKGGSPFAPSKSRIGRSCDA